jgi:hypothetical protein
LSDQRIHGNLRLHRLLHHTLPASQLHQLQKLQQLHPPPLQLQPLPSMLMPQQE